MKFTTGKYKVHAFLSQLPGITPYMCGIQRLAVLKAISKSTYYIIILLKEFWYVYRGTGILVN